MWPSVTSYTAPAEYKKEVAMFPERFLNTLQTARKDSLAEVIGRVGKFNEYVNLPTGMMIGAFPACPFNVAARKILPISRKF